MDKRFIHQYNIELQHLRQMAREFAADYPRVAGKLALDREDEEQCPDPFVERLLEGFAFLSARVQYKLEAEFPRFTQGLLETIYPHFLSPTPSMAVVRFDPDEKQGSLVAGAVIPRGTVLRTPTRKEPGKPIPTACEYRTAHEVRLWPLRVAEARYFAEDVVTLDLPAGAEAKAAIRIRLEAIAGLSLKQIQFDSLTFFLRGSDEVPVSLYEQIFAHASAVVIQSASRPVRHFDRLPVSNIRTVGFCDEEALLPFGLRSFSGYRLLREYFAFPQRFLFVEITGLHQAAQACGDKQLDLVIPLKENVPSLHGRVHAGCFELFCTPAINLFPKTTDRIPLSNRFSEFRAVVDVTRPLDYEIFEAKTVTGFGSLPGEEQEFRPFYLARDEDESIEMETRPAAFFTLNRVQRSMTEKEIHSGRREYLGSDVYVSLVDARAAPYNSQLKSLGLQVLCTNRHLPMQIAVGKEATDFKLDISAPVSAIRCLAGPTPPRSSPAEGNLSWRLISHLSLNYLSLVDADGEQGATALREMLKLYGDSGDPVIARQIEGVRSIRSAPIARIITMPGPPGPGDWDAADGGVRTAAHAPAGPRSGAEAHPPPIAFARGLELTVTFDEQPFAGTGLFLLGAVLEQFFARYVTLNSFTETVLKSQQRKEKEIMRWPARTGRRQPI